MEDKGNVHEPTHQGRGGEPGGLAAAAGTDIDVLIGKHAQATLRATG
jgi:hypothetical protein